MVGSLGISPPTLILFAFSAAFFAFAVWRLFRDKVPRGRVIVETRDGNTFRGTFLDDEEFAREVKERGEEGLLLVYLNSPSYFRPFLKEDGRIVILNTKKVKKISPLFFEWGKSSEK